MRMVAPARVFFTSAFLFWAGIVTTRGQVHSNELIFNKLTTNDGLSHNTVQAIAQDRKGFIWFGTTEGLNRYDGTSILTFYADPHDTTRLASNQVTALQTGGDGRLYIGTSLGLYTYDDSQEMFRHIGFERSDAGYVHEIVKTADGSLLIGSSKGAFLLKTGQQPLLQHIHRIDARDVVEFRKGVFWVASPQKILMINTHGEVLREYTTLYKTSGRSVSMDENVFCLFKDSYGDIWIGSKKDGLFRYDQAADSFIKVGIKHRFNPLEVNAVRVLSEDAHKRLWVGTESGLFIYDRAGGSFQHYTQSFDQSPATLSDKAIYSIYRSREGIMWIGTYFGGVNIVKPLEKGFRTLGAGGGYRKLSGKAVSDIIQDRRGRLWIATEDGGVNIWDRKTGSISYLKNEFSKEGLNVNNVHCIYEDEQDVFWIGTFLGGINKYDLKKKTVTVYKKDQDETSAFAGNMIYAIHKDRNGEMWIGGTGGLSKFNYKKDIYEPFRPEIFQGQFVYDIYEDRAGRLWICLNGVGTLYRYDPATAQLRRFDYDPGFSFDQGFICTFQDSKGRMWFGTVNQGLLQLEQSGGVFTAYKVAHGLPNDYVYGILEDDHGNLWLSTNKGLSKFNVEDREFINYDISHGLPNNQFNYKSSFSDRDGWMYFGTVNGLCYFHPDSLKTNTVAPTTYLSDLKLFNKSVNTGAGSILENSIDDTKEITLSYSNNVITFEFGAINYYSSENNAFAYYLEGFENDWNYVKGKNNATYTNLSPGEYVFRVKSANNDGFWSENGKQLKITILPPFWLTKWAMAVYGIFIIALVVAYKSYLNRRSREKMSVQVERMEKEKIREINQHKLNFFTYITHEFKTPLTLIMVSIDKFLQDRSLSGEQHAGYRSIRRSAKRLHSLIDQLMEFRRVETDHAQVHYAKGDIIAFLRDTFMAFSPLFNKKRIDFYFNSDASSFSTFFDADKLEKIIANLLSNAAKYTNEHGAIEMETAIKANPDAPHDILKITIHDSGVGIGPDELKNAFMAFYQTEHGRKAGSGTGIGLALVKSLTDFLNGAIEISNEQPSGTQITLTLPLPRQVDNGNIALVDGNRTIDIEHVLPVAGDGDDQEEQPHSADRKYQLMIVEDSEELINFLGGHFNKKYKIVKAPNGAAALDKIRKSPPDIIVSDIMMPEMDGVELCRAVKADIGTSHIPVILLTARATSESRLHGLDGGADAYIPKPFSLRELEIVIKNLLTMHDKLKAHFLKFGMVKDVDRSVTNRDQEFILKLTQIVEKHLDNSDFNITLFAQEACVSRSLLHLKLKKLVNLSASEFIRHIRLQKAAELLEGTDQTISEIAYKVGYADSNYFSRSFKEKYRVNPSEYKQAKSRSA